MKRCAFTLAALAIAVGSTAAAAATKINKCPTTITVHGSYELQDNLDAIGDCIIVQADGVTIDLGGFTIHGNGTGSAVVDRPQPAAGPIRGTTVRNGTVTKFFNGLSLDRGVIQDVHSIDNANVGIAMESGLVRNCFVMGNVNNHGISVFGGVVEGNFVSKNLSGIVSGNGGALIRGNSVTFNSNAGILTLEGNSIIDNTVLQNGTFGIHVECPALVLGNTSTYSAQNLTTVGVGCTTDHNAAP